MARKRSTVGESVTGEIACGRNYWVPDEMIPSEWMKVIGHFRVVVNLIMKARLSAKFLL